MQNPVSLLEELMREARAHPGPDRLPPLKPALCNSDAAFGSTIYKFV
jgi:hypothetical protein